LTSVPGFTREQAEAHPAWDGLKGNKGCRETAWTALKKRRRRVLSMCGTLAGFFLLRLPAV